MKSRLTEKISILRKRLGYTQEEFAELLGIKRSRYANWEQTGKFPFERIVKIAGILGMSLDELLEDTDLEARTRPVPIVEPILGGPDQLHNIKPATELKLNSTEKSVIRIYRTLKKEQQQEVFDLINKFYKGNKG